MGNTFGQLFRVTTWGESHGLSVGAVIDGCPPRLALDEAYVQRQLDRRRPGQSNLTTPRREADRVTIVSGVYEGQTLGTPIALWVANSDARGTDYSELRAKYRPSHADYTYEAKYGIRAVEGGGRASARETIGRVAAGAVAELVIAETGIEVVAWVERIHDISSSTDPNTVTRDQVDATAVRCPDVSAAEEMIDCVQRARKSGDSVGGVISVVARNVPPGLGMPVFDKLDAELAHALMSLPAAKGFEIGSGFGGTLLTGSDHNDEFYTDDKGSIRTRTNRSGGVQGGISNGEPIQCRVAFKPTATIMRAQNTVTVDGEPTTLAPKGRHDPCVLPRAVPIVEAMVTIVLADHWLRQRGQIG